MMQDSQQPLNLDAARERLAGLQGKQFWRGLEELAETAEFQELLHREFPRQASGFIGPMTRRSFLKLMGASLALAGLTACGAEQPAKIVPYVEAPEEIVPGKPLFFASALKLGWGNIGVLVENHMGRPTKIEGNPNHPASLGATDAIAQASILTLYDPDRSQAVLNVGQISSWDSFVATITQRMQAQGGNGGAGLRILTETITSPTLISQMEALLDAFPQAQWHQYEPVGRDNVRAGAQLAFGQDVNIIYRFDQADRILSLDADFLSHEPGSLAYSRQFIDKRRLAEGQPEMNRLYVVESTPTITGAMADHRLAMRASQIESVARAVAQQLGVADVAAGATLPEEVTAWLDAALRDLQEYQGTSLVLAGDAQPPVVHALAHAINEALGNVGATVDYIPPIEANPVDQNQSLRELVDAMNAGDVDTLLILGGNPVFTAPVDLQFADALSNVSFRVHLSLYEDETSQLCHWHIPETHELEAWSDVRAFDGTAAIVQPLIMPLYGGKSAHELVAVLQGQPAGSAYDIVREYWQGQELADDNAWRAALHAGVIENTAFEPVQVSLQSGFAAQAPDAAAQPADGQNLEINFRPDPALWDGRYANNGWLQEWPKPLTLLTWDNAALMSPRTAVQILGVAVSDPDHLQAEDLERLTESNGQMVELNVRGETANFPVWIMPGHPDDSVTVYLGYGRRNAGNVGNGVGFNAYAIRPSDAPWFSTELQVRALGEHYPLATVQTHHTMEGRHLVRVGTLEQYIEHPDFVAEFEHAPTAEEATEGEQALQQPPSLYPEYDYSDVNRWGMAIDLNACIGCNACILACQAENNIPIVGKDEVLNSREMHWLRVDRYYEGDLNNPATFFEPIPCMHCEKAPCEPVCPVMATSHSREGLNEMTYNRCVGTRYCSNNCPYKVRRFNFFQYTREDVPVFELMRNPDVTVRERGVMEKCTYCVQRINAARIEAKKENREIQDGEIQTACQEVCPTRAIIFGNINDTESRVRQLKDQPRNYSLLTELGTQPRTTYQARLRNPNPELEATQPSGESQH